MSQLPVFRNYIAGTWQPTEPTSRALTNPNTTEVIGYQASSSAIQIEQALVAAEASFANGSWALTKPQQRADVLEAIARLLEQQQEAIAQLDSMQNGVVIAQTRLVAAICPAAFKAAAQLLRSQQSIRYLPGTHSDVEVERLPLGVAVIITPWNAPSGIACHKLASALAAGCSVIFKPSEWAAASAQLIAEAIAAAGLPAGVFSLLHGSAMVGSRLVRDERCHCVSFTGGAVGGAAIGKVCGEQIKPVQLELGGNNPMVVLASANTDQAADAIVTGLTTMNAQWCRALGRILVHQDISAELLGKVTERLAQLQLGSSDDSCAQMGPLVHQGHYQHIRQCIEQYRKQGAEILQPTPLPALPGYFVPPTLVLGLAPELTLEEVFGPVACWHTFSTEQQATALANQTPFGLAAYVFGDEPSAWQLARTLRTGGVKINAISLLNLNPMAPRPAWGKSGLGDEGVVETFEFFRGNRVIGVAG
ncbi:aldehyde dehydrogenase family protein [Alkalimonas sp.]|uniref:aldehyde dehydrogenase family protein n=1 Tax=Alkalimonas sp. TaxID=1872453 RepID=UPI00263ACBDA|nr:aldehyde dehydrogenase family protein [Alkalimonas sp.]MCC5825033.1 aldehyde dehydrogenase [Alkalimonas sp.]